MVANVRERRPLRAAASRYNIRVNHILITAVMVARCYQVQALSTRLFAAPTRSLQAPRSETALARHCHCSRRLGRQSASLGYNSDLDYADPSEQPSPALRAAYSRRECLHSAWRRALTLSGAIGISAILPTLAVAADDAQVDNSPSSITTPMKKFVDPQGLFEIEIPTNFFAIRRTVKGDLPDAETGTGRRGSSIFTAGDLNKAEVVAVER
jgi:hypothetical protein